MLRFKVGDLVRYRHTDSTDPSNIMVITDINTIEVGIGLNMHMYLIKMSNNTTYGPSFEYHLNQCLIKV